MKKHLIIYTIILTINVMMFLSVTGESGRVSPPSPDTRLASPLELQQVEEHERGYYENGI